MILLLSQTVQIERVQRLTQFEHDEVGHVHHIVDAALAYASRRWTSQRGEGPTFTDSITRAM